MDGGRVGIRGDFGGHSCVGSKTELLILKPHVISRFKMIVIPNRSSPITISTPTYRSSSSSGDSGGGDPNPEFFLLLLGYACTFIGIGGCVSLMHRPRLQMKFITTANGYDAMIRRVNFPTNLFFQYNNISFLCKENGYIVQIPNQLPREGYKYNNWRRIASIETQKSFDEFRADCKKGRVHSEIYYQYDSFWIEKEITKEQKLYWHKQPLDKLA